MSRHVGSDGNADQLHAAMPNARTATDRCGTSALVKRSRAWRECGMDARVETRWGFERCESLGALFPAMDGSECESRRSAQVAQDVVACQPVQHEAIAGEGFQKALEPAWTVIRYRVLGASEGRGPLQRS